MQHPAVFCSSHTLSGVMPGTPRASRHSFRDRVAAARRVGYDGLWLHLRDYAEQRAAGYSDGDLQAILRDAGMAVAGFEFLTGWDGDSTAASASEEQLWRMADAFGPALISVGAAAGSGNIGQLGESFAGLVERSAAHGLQVGLEIVPWSRVPDLHIAGEVLDLVPAAGLVIDSWHVFRGGIDLAALALLPAHRIMAIQINDALAAPQRALDQDTLHRLSCGAGELPLAPFVTALRQSGCRVPLSVEIISPELAALALDEAAIDSMRGVAALARL